MENMKKQMACFVSFGLAVVSLGGIEPAATVDFTAGKGAVKRLNGICNCLPLGKNRDATHCEWFDALEFPEIRFHDQAASNGGQAIADISRVFPLAHADADDPRNYDFKATDDYIDFCRRFTDRIEFRIGEQIEHTEHHYRIFPPKDYAKYARVCLNIVRHYNEGWANGFHWNIRRWGIWEEPDNKCLFDGDYEKEFFPLYAAIAKTLKAAYPDLQVGGPSTRGREMFRAEKFVAYCRANQVPLDFCAITEYRRSVDKIIAIGEQTRTILDTNGFAKAEVTMSEWHYEPCRWGGNTPETAKEAWDDCMGIDSAAFTAGVLASAQDSPFDRMFFYATDKGQFGLFDFRECRRGAPWSAFKAFADVARLEERVATTADASRGFYALAAKGADGRGALMLAALRTPEKGPVRVAVRGGLVPGEVLVDAGDRVKRLEPAAGWTFADGVLTLPPVGRSAIWFVGFGDYRARKLACDEPKVEKVAAPLMSFKREDGKLDFALIVDAENRALTAAPVKKMRDDYSYALGETPEVFGDNDNEKLSQVKWHVVFGDSAYARSLGADVKTLKDGEYLIRTFERGVLVVGKDAAANAKALKRLCALLSEGRMTLAKLDLTGVE